MKTLNKFILSAVTAAVTLSACDAVKDFGDINYDPNSPSTAFTNYLFTFACRYVPYFSLGSDTSGYDPWLQEWTGYISESKNNQYGPLGTTITYSGVGTMYLYPLKNLHMIIEMNEDEDQKNDISVTTFGTSANQIAASKTLSAYFYMSLTDIYGPIVLSQAFQGVSDDNWKPEYDSQEDVYRQLDEMLTEAYKQFDESGSLSSADIIYNGNIAKWKKFNASLRMLLAIKLCDVDPATGKSRFAAAYADGGMETVADGFNYSYDDLTWNRLYYWCSPNYSAAGFTQVPNMFIVEQMKELKDNRMFKYFDIEGYRGSRDEETFPRDDYNSFYGIPFGLVDNNAVAAWVDCTASIGSAMLAMDATVPVIPTARVLLTEAEAAYRGWISADAKALYEAGIKASFEQWGATGADAYVGSAGVNYDPANGLEQIAIQRWIASYLSDGVEVWSDWRRLDIPYMPVGPGAVNNGVTHYPYRLGYYTDYDVAYNYDNYVKAVAQLYGGVDDVNSRVWWDVADNREGVLTDEQCKAPVQVPADWQPVCTGTYYYDVLGSFDENFTEEVTTLYEDVNHPGEFKLSPWGGNTELFFSSVMIDGEPCFAVTAQEVGVTFDGYNVWVADFDQDQGTENGYTYYDEDDECYYFVMIYRKGGPRGSAENAGIIAYDYEAFVPDAN